MRAVANTNVCRVGIYKNHQIKAVDGSRFGQYRILYGSILREESGTTINLTEDQTMGPLSRREYCIPHHVGNKQVSTIQRSFVMYASR